MYNKRKKICLVKNFVKFCFIRILLYMRVEGRVIDNIKIVINEEEFIYKQMMIFDR